MSMTVQQPTRQGAEPERPAWLPADSFPFQSRYIDVGRQRIHYIDEGSGPALLFVSAGFWAFMFRDVILRLRDDFRCVCLDFPGSGLSPLTTGAIEDQGVLTNAGVLEGFVRALDLQDVNLVLHDVGGPIGFKVAAAHPEWIRSLVLSNTFGWPLAEYRRVAGMLRFVASPVFGAVNTNFNLLAAATALSFGVGRRLSKADRVVFKGPWRSRSARRTTQRVLAGAGRIDGLMHELEPQLETVFSELPVLTVFGRRNDPYGWQDRFGRMFGNVTAVGIDDGNHFPFCDDPEKFSRAITEWWRSSVANARRR
jgi:pimeloyl-ACP methyl ester carboxylesterase